MRARSLLALIVLVALAGCGGSGPARGSRAAYDQGLKAAAQAMQDAFVGSGLLSTTANYRALVAALRDAANRLERLQPPPEAAPDNRKLVNGLRFWADREQAILDAGARQDRNTVERLARGLSERPEIQQALAAIKDLQRKGYRGVAGFSPNGSG
jgi:uncharacterized lipoprotein